MKLKTYIYSIILAATFLSATSCKDFLDSKINSSITSENFYGTESDFQAATAALYTKVWFDFNDKFYYGLGDGRGFNIFAPYSDYIYPFTDLSETGLTGPLVSAWQALYNVVQQSNRVIKGIKESPFGSEELKSQYIAEARFMRGTAYSYLVMLWGNVIISEDTDALIANPIINTNPASDVWEFVMRDFEYAAKYLPTASFAPGRVNRYSAFAMLSRVYLTVAGFGTDPNSGVRNAEYLNLAKNAALKVINESSFDLMDNYADLFEIDNNNNKESIFALQWVPGDAGSTHYGVNNSLQAYFACGSEITGDDASWGYWTRAQPDVIWEYEQGDYRRKATWMGYGDNYPTIQASTGGYTYEKTKEALNIKKYVCGSSKDHPKISRMNCPINSYMMRLAEVYLNYTEAVLGDNATLSNPVELEYFNMVRERAGLNAMDVIGWEDIRRERRLELCLEGQYWYDIVRRSYYKQQEMINYIISQKRDVINPVLWDTDTQTLGIDPDRDPSSRAIGNIDASIFLLAYPESETVQNPLLREAPVPYVFTEARITDLF